MIERITVLKQTTTKTVAWQRYKKEFWVQKLSILNWETEICKIIKIVSLWQAISNQLESFAVVAFHSVLPLLTLTNILHPMPFFASSTSKFRQKKQKCKKKAEMQKKRCTKSRGCICFQEYKWPNNKTFS